MIQVRVEPSNTKVMCQVAMQQVEPNSLGDVELRSTCFLVLFQYLEVFLKGFFFLGEEDSVVSSSEDV